MKKYITTFILALIIGLVIGRFILNQYTFEGKIVSTFNKQEKAYFIQQGVYSSKENMESATSSLPYYIYSVEDNNSSLLRLSTPHLINLSLGLSSTGISFILIDIL